MAGDYDGDRVRSVGGAHRTHGPGRSDRGGDLAVAARLSERDASRVPARRVVGIRCPAGRAGGRSGAIFRRNRRATGGGPRRRSGEFPSGSLAIGAKARIRWTRNPESLATSRRVKPSTTVDLGKIEHGPSLSQPARRWFSAPFWRRIKSYTCYNWISSSLCRLSLSHPITARTRRSFCSSPVVFAPVSSGLSM